MPSHKNIYIMPKVIKPVSSIYNSGIEYPSIIDSSFSEHDIRHAEIIFAVSMVYVIMPLLYTAFISFNPELMQKIWCIIHSGIFNKFCELKEFLSNKIAFMMRYFGYYTFSTYTVVKNGREVFSSFSEYINVRTYRQNIKTVDMAKYKVCKWIDTECANYRLKHNNELPDVSEEKNDIYDFIIHSSPDYKQTRIHRGDFRISTHTQFNKNYRKFCNSCEINNYLELIVKLPGDNSDDNTSENIPICVKYPDTFYIEKNVLFDRAFLKWYAINKLHRNDIAEYIGSSTSEYKLVLYNNDFIKIRSSENPLLFKTDLTTETTNDSIGETENVTDGVNDVETDVFMTILPGQHIVVGSVYIIKADTVLNCPIYKIKNKDVISINDEVNMYYYDSEEVSSDYETEESVGVKWEDKAIAVNDSDDRSDMSSDSGADSSDNDSSDGVDRDADSGATDDKNNKHATYDKNIISSEFEMIE